MEDEEHFVPDYEEEEEADDHSLSGLLGPVVALRRRSGCIDCSDRGPVFHLKTHDLHHHSCLGAYWFLYPLLACWVCRTHKNLQHLNAHGRLDSDSVPSSFLVSFLVLVTHLSSAVQLGQWIRAAATSDFSMLRCLLRHLKVPAVGQIQLDYSQHPS